MFGGLRYRDYFTKAYGFSIYSFTFFFFQFREIVGDIDGARNILQRGRDCFAEPLSLLNDASDALEMRQIQASLVNHTVDHLDEYEPRRIALGGISGTILIITAFILEKLTKK